MKLKKVLTLWYNQELKIRTWKIQPDFFKFCHRDSVPLKQLSFYSGDSTTLHLYSCAGDGSVLQHKTGHFMEDAVDVNALILKTNNLKVWTCVLDSSLIFLMVTCQFFLSRSFIVDMVFFYFITCFGFVRAHYFSLQKQCITKKLSVNNKR